MRVAVLVLAVVLAATALGLWWLTRPVPATVMVYFVRDDGVASTVVPVTRTVRARGTGPLVAAALRELLAGPTDTERSTGLTTAIPAGTSLRSVRLDRGVVMADFNRPVESGGGSASMLGRFWQIVYTATQLPSAPRLRILIEGERRESMGGEGVMIDRPIARPRTPPRF
ncbi:MAG: GerMN domain-containing protein [Armatimonadetes bacterium]|nr:GerMN domain-containing protein [Armatimonadota bacterium]